MRRAPGLQVGNRVGKITDFGLKQGKGFRKRAPRIFQHILYTNGGSLCQAFLSETVETGTKNRCVIEALHVLQRKLRKD